MIGIFGGSGFYSLLEKTEIIKTETPYGNTSDDITIGRIGNKKVAFLPRHGKSHSIAPHKIPYRANIWAMKELGVKRIIGPCAAGSLMPEVKPGDFVICDQFIDRTSGRIDTFYDGPKVTHISSADPYCSQLRDFAHKACVKLNIPVHPDGTMVIIQGPRFSTRAESKWFSSIGCSVINMTGYPECILARELEICYVNISLITDYDAGMAGLPSIDSPAFTGGALHNFRSAQIIKPVSTEEVIQVFKENNEKIKKVIFKMIETMPEERNCSCQGALKGASLS